jgi:DNA polymerase-1
MTHSMSNRTEARAVESGDHLYLIDGSGYIFRAYHALPALTRKSDGLPVGAAHGFCAMLHKLLRELPGGVRPTHLAVIFDKSETTFRNELYDGYKANRPPPPSDLVPQFAIIRQAVRAFNVPCIEQQGYEADDLIATYARQAVEQGATVRIVSSDKDLMQLVTDSIKLYDTMKERTSGQPKSWRNSACRPPRWATFWRWPATASTMCRAFPASASRPAPSSSPNMAISKPFLPALT